ncbi:MAG: putative LPS assembly protein LptD [bacterium]|nr:putative LPS assembly protein LptD [bacterium]
METIFILAGILTSATPVIPLTSSASVESTESVKTYPKITDSVYVLPKADSLVILQKGGQALKKKDGQALQKKEGTSTYKGDTLVYMWNDKVIWLKGDANIKTPEVRANADTIKYELNNEIVTIWGNPVLWVGSQDSITGRKMKYNLQTEQGVILDGRTKMDKGWFEGRIIRKVDTSALNIDYGKFTTCERRPPHYYFWARELKVYIDDMIYLKPLVFFVGEIPLFAAPFWWFPIKKGRQSGWLHLPKVGSSSDKGKYIENLSYYWVTNKYSDITATLNYFEIQGLQSLLEGRWVFSQYSSGGLNGSYIKERDTGGQKGNERWMLQLNHSQKMASRMSLIVRGNFESDTKYETDYSDTTVVKLDKIIDSYMSMNKSWDRASVNLIVRERKNLADTTENSVQRTIPGITYGLTPIRISKGYFSYSGGISNLKSGTLDYQQTWDNSATFTLPFNIFRYIAISPSTGHSYSFKKPIPNVKPYHSRYSVTASTNIYGKSIFKPEIRHISSPNISFSLVDTTKSLSFGVNNEFQFVYGEKKISLGAINLSGNRDFVHNKFNDINIYSYSRAIPLVDLQAYSTYKTSEKKLKFDRLTVGSSLVRKTFNLSTTYSWVPDTLDERKSIWGTLNVNLTRNWKASMARRYDIVNKNTIEESYSLYRDLHCWDIAFSFNKYGENWKYNVQIKLKALPEIKYEKHYESTGIE